MPIPCEKCGRKSLNKRGGFVNIAVYMCKCGSETFHIETDVEEILKNAETRGHPLCGNWTVDDLLEMLKKQDVLTVRERSEAEKHWARFRKSWSIKDINTTGEFEKRLKQNDSWIVRDSASFLVDLNEDSGFLSFSILAKGFDETQRIIKADIFNLHSNRRQTRVKYCFSYTCSKM
jgi:hypothetical protein